MLHLCWCHSSAVSKEHKIEYSSGMSRGVVMTSRGVVMTSRGVVAGCLRVESEERVFEVGVQTVRSVVVQTLDSDRTGPSDILVTVGVCCS